MTTESHHFCTLFDSNYLIKGVAMLRSLLRNCPSAHVHVLCMDHETQKILKQLALPHITSISLDEVEDQILLEVKQKRSIAEYCWTLSPCLPWHVLKVNPEINAITYLDADLYFYSSLQPLFDEIGNASIAIIEHRFPPPLKHLELRGRFCVEWVGFLRNEEGLSCLARWREQCIDWCYYRLEENRMGDQKYLDSWPTDFQSVHILQHPGGGVAPWNYSQYEFGLDENGIIRIDGKPLIFYHFHQMQILSNGCFNRLSDSYTFMGKEPELVYIEYEKALIQVLAEIHFFHPEFNAGMKSASRVYAQRLAQKLLPEVVKEWFKKYIKAV